MKGGVSEGSLVKMSLGWVLRPKGSIRTREGVMSWCSSHAHSKQRTLPLHAQSWDFTACHPGSKECSNLKRPRRPWWSGPGLPLQCKCCPDLSGLRSSPYAPLADLMHVRVLCTERSYCWRVGQGRPVALETERGEMAACQPKRPLLLHSWP